MKNSELEAVDKALTKLGENELPYRLTDEVLEKLEKSAAGLQRVRKTHRAMLAARLPKGVLPEQLGSEPEVRRALGVQGYREVIWELNALMNDEVKIDWGAPVDLRSLEDKIEKLNLSAIQLHALRAHGLIIDARTVEKAEAAANEAGTPAPERPEVEETVAAGDDGAPEQTLERQLNG